AQLTRSTREEAGALSPPAPPGRRRRHSVFPRRHPAHVRSSSHTHTHIHAHTITNIHITKNKLFHYMTVYTISLFIMHTHTHTNTHTHTHTVLLPNLAHLRHVWCRSVVLW